MADREPRVEPVPVSVTSVGALMAELTLELSASIPDAGREAREIVAALYDVPRFWPVVNAHAGVSAEMQERARAAVAMRSHGAPLAYAVGRASFRHLTLCVDQRVLIPRPETELIVDIVLEAQGGVAGGVVVDVGTGSGAIALALATEGRFAKVVATDVSLDALTVARENSLRVPHPGTPIEFAHGSLLAPLEGKMVRAVVSNPPYIASGEAEELPASVRDWEPAVALISGADGLGATRPLVAQAATALEPGGVFVLEVDVRRASIVAELVGQEPRFAEVSVRLDLTGRERFVFARRSENP